MIVGELLVKLGITGGEKAADETKKVTRGLDSIKSSSLAAKAAILGMVYGLQKMMSQSANQGNDLVNFSALTGQSIKTLQEYQYAGRQVGITNEEVAQSFVALQKTVGNTLMGIDQPAGLARLAELTGEIDADVLSSWQQDPAKLIQRLQEYAKKEQNVGLRNFTISSFGLGDDMTAGIIRNAFRPDVFKNAPKYSDAQAKQLDKVKAQWSNLGTQVEQAFGQFTSKHGLQIITGLNQITTQVFKLIDALTVLAEKLKLFWILGKAVEHLAKFMSMLGDSVTQYGNMGNFKSTVEPGKGGIGQFWKEAFKNSAEDTMDFLKGSKMSIEELFGGPEKSVTPKVEKGKDQGSNINFNQNLNFNDDGRNPRSVGRAAEDGSKKGVQEAYRQMFGQMQVT